MKRRQLIQVVCAALVVILTAVGAATARPLSARSAISERPGFSAFSQTARLPEPAGTVGILRTATSSQTIAVSADQTRDGQPPVTSVGVYAYGKPAGGWTSSLTPAELQLPVSTPDPFLAAADRFVVATYAGQSSAGDSQAAVYTRPASGWAGVVQPSALLDFTGATGVIQPDVAVTSTTAFLSGGSAIDVYPEPATGWAGEQEPAATLSVPGADSTTLAATNGATVVAMTTSHRALYVFQRPDGGWAGSITPIATITVPGYIGDGLSDAPAVVMSADLLAVENTAITGATPSVSVYSRPSNGWTNMTTPSTTLLAIGLKNDLTNGGLAIAAVGQRIAVQEDTWPTHSPCPCGVSNYLVSQPPSGGWPKTTILRNSRVGDDTSDPGLQPLGSQLLTRDGTTDPEYGFFYTSGLSVDSIAPAPELTAADWTEIATQRPQLRLVVRPSRAGAMTRRIAVQLPAGIRLQARPQQPLAEGAHAAMTSHTQDELTLTLSDIDRRQITITLGRGVLSETQSLEHRLAGLQREAAAHPRPLTLVTRLGLQTAMAGTRHAVITTVVR